MPRRQVHPLARAQRSVEEARAKLAQAESDRDAAVAAHAEEHPELSYTDLAKLLEGGLSKTGVRVAIMRARRR